MLGVGIIDGHDKLDVWFVVMSDALVLLGFLGFQVCEGFVRCARMEFLDFYREVGGRLDAELLEEELFPFLLYLLE